MTRPHCITFLHIAHMPCTARLAVTPLRKQLHGSPYTDAVTDQSPSQHRSSQRLINTGGLYTTTIEISSTAEPTRLSPQERWVAAVWVKGIFLEPLSQAFIKISESSRRKTLMVTSQKVQTAFKHGKSEHLLSTAGTERGTQAKKDQCRYIPSR